MTEVMHSLVSTWFHLVEQWGYLGVFVLMALESSIFPVPSEIVMPPAAFWAAQGRMNFWLVIVAGTTGSYFGSIVTYFVAKTAGRPLVNKYGKYFFLSEEKILLTEKWLEKNGPIGVFISRLLPVIRHLISIPAGVFKMNVKSFSIMTISGAFLCCLVLSWFGKEVIGNSPQLLNSPQELILVLKQRLHWFVVAAFMFGAVYITVKMTVLKKNKQEFQNK